MANIKVVCPKLFFRDLRGFVRCLNTTVTAQVVEPTGSQISTDKKVINLEDVKELFKGVPTSKLIRSSLTLQMASIEPMVDFGIWVMNSKLMVMPISRQVIMGFVRSTFYEHFCAGKELPEVHRTVTMLSDAGLKAMLDYGMEHATDDESCDQSMKVFLQTAELTKSLPKSSVSFVVVKVTAICTPKLLKRVSDLLRWQHKHPSFILPWKVKSLPVFADASPLYHTTQKPEPLTVEEERDLELAQGRLSTISKKCLEHDVCLLIDAEDTAIEPAINYVTYSAAVKYHRGDEPLIFGTIQAYLKDARERMVLAKRAAEKMGVPIGFKLVRGAYMSSERELASKLGVESPIHDSIQETHDCYNSCAEFMLNEIVKGSGSAFVLASHNIDSVKMAARKAISMGIRKDDQKLQFAQLYGMSERLSFGLRNAGFQVSKYLPFGSVEQVMPYLIRRAEENRGLLSASILDMQLMRKELTRRMKATSRIHEPER